MAGALMLHGILGLSHLNAGSLGLYAIGVGSAFLISAFLLRYVKKSMRNIMSGSQKNCEEFVEKQKCNEYLIQLNQRCSQSGIIFDPSSMTQCLRGGTCIAKSLAFLSMYFLTRPRDIESFYASRQSVFESSSTKDRDVQAALNCLKIVEKIGDIERKKVQACLNLSDIKIVSASETVNFNAPNFSESSIFSNLSKGIYFVRSLKPYPNEKGELYGHSMVLIKSKSRFSRSRFYLYEPNTGLHKTYKKSDLLPFFEEQHRKHEIPHLRLYKCKYFSSD